LYQTQSFGQLLITYIQSVCAQDPKIIRRLFAAEGFYGVSEGRADGLNTDRQQGNARYSSLKTKHCFFIIFLINPASSEQGFQINSRLYYKRTSSQVQSAL